MDAQDLKRRFNAHPVTDHQSGSMLIIRKVAAGFAQEIDDLVADGREKSLAITHLEEVVFWANAGIAREDVA